MKSGSKCVYKTSANTKEDSSRKKKGSKSCKTHRKNLKMSKVIAFLPVIILFVNGLNTAIKGD